MAWTVTEFPSADHRLLVCEAESEEELEQLRSKAQNKGWEFYAEGTAPSSQRLSIWLIKRDPGHTPAT